MVVKKYINQILENMDNSCLAFSVFGFGRGVDITSTLSALENHGTNWEANPLPKFFMENFGIYSGMFVHELVGFGLISIAYALYKKYTPGKENILPYICGATSIAVGINNLLV